MANPGLGYSLCMQWWGVLGRRVSNRERAPERADGAVGPRYWLQLLWSVVCTGFGAFVVFARAADATSLTLPLLTGGAAGVALYVLGLIVWWGAGRLLMQRRDEQD